MTTKIPVELSSTPSIVDNGDATAITITSGEEVGIGTTTPNSYAFNDPAKLVVANTSGHSTISLVSGTSSKGYFAFADGTSGTARYPGSIQYDHSSNYLSFHTNDGTERMRIDSNGKLLIGDSASHVDDLLQIESPASGGGHGIQIRRNDSNTDQSIGRVMFGNNTDTDLATISAKTDGANDSGALLFATQTTGGASTERMRIGSSGVVNVGTTEGTAKFNVGNGSGNALIEMASSSATAVYYEHINRSNTSGSVDVGYYARNTGDFKFYTGSYTVRFTINENGGSNGSDEKLKKDIENISYGLDTVKSLQPRKFKWKETDNDGIGFIAQEVESLIPEVVADTTDAKGETDEVTKVLNYANLTAVLTKAIQEQQAIIEDLQTQINEVKNGN